MARWRVPAALSVAVVAAQLAHRSPLTDVVSGTAPSDLRLAYPALHVALAPLTLLADWLNGGSTQDLKGFAAWTLLVYALWRLLARSGAGRTAREVASAGALLAGFALFISWGALARRPIPRLVAGGQDMLVFDVHSHTALSHDGRRGFGAAANAGWHERAGFDAAFVTDHNTVGAAREWEMDRAGRGSRLLSGEELSLSGLHVIVLGNTGRIANEPWNRSWDSTLLLLRSLGDQPPATGHRPYLIASLPEYWRHHWGPDIGALAQSGIEGFEIWTSSPQAMDFPPRRRLEMVVRAWEERRALFGATDMHGLGYTASVWNVARLPGWREMDDSTLTWALVGLLRQSGPDASRVVAIRRWQPDSPLAAAVAVPVNLALVLSQASRAHAALLLVWIWAPLLAISLRTRRRSR